MMPFLVAGDAGAILLQVYVQPKSSRNKVVGPYDGALKIAVTSPPVDGKANKAVTAYLAKILGIAKRDVELVAGHGSRRKTLKITGKTMEDLRVHIGSILSD